MMRWIFAPIVLLLTGGCATNESLDPVTDDSRIPVAYKRTYLFESGSGVFWGVHDHGEKPHKHIPEGAMIRPVTSAEGEDDNGRIAVHVFARSDQWARRKWFWSRKKSSDWAYTIAAAKFHFVPGNAARHAAALDAEGKLSINFGLLFNNKPLPADLDVCGEQGLLALLHIPHVVARDVELHDTHRLPHDVCIVADKPFDMKPTADAYRLSMVFQFPASSVNRVDMKGDRRPMHPGHATGTD